MERPGPLHGVRVLEFSLIVAGPFAGVVLSDLGADVVKIEPPGGEDYRASGAVVPHEGKRFQSLNRGKRALQVDLQDERGRALIQRMVPDFDVVTMNYAPGVAERLGVDYETLRTLHPGLVYCRISGFGPSGPWADAVATDIVCAAYSGLLAGNGGLVDEREPRQIRPPIADYTTGLASAMAICAALYHRRESGQGQLIDASLLRSALAIQDVYVMREPVADATLRDTMMERLEALRDDGASYAEQLRARDRYRSEGAGPPRLYYSGYEASDGAIVIGCLTARTRARARELLGMTEDRSDEPDFDTREPEHQRRMDGWVEQVRAKIRRRSVAEWISDFRAAGIPAAPVHVPEEVADDPQVQAAGVMWELEHAVTGPQRVVGPIVEMSETPTRAYRAAPALGQYADQVLADSGLTPAEINALRADGIIG